MVKGESWSTAAGKEMGPGGGRAEVAQRGTKVCSGTKIRQHSMDSRLGRVCLSSQAQRLGETSRKRTFLFLALCWV